MVIGTAFTLFIVPAIYTIVAKVHKQEDVEEPMAGGEVPELARV
jgi:hypothetical protein